MIYIILTFLLAATFIVLLLLRLNQKRRVEAYPTPPPSEKPTSRLSSPWITRPLRRRSDRIARRRLILRGTIYSEDSDDSDKTARQKDWESEGRTSEIERKVLDWMEEFPTYPCDRDIKEEPITPVLPPITLPDADTWLGDIRLWEAIYGGDLTDLSDEGEWNGDDGWGEL